MRNLILLLLTTIATVTSYGQEITRELRSFRKVIASPHINLVLEKGDNESIRLVYARISPEKINIDVSGNTLRIYLDDAKVIEKTEKAGWNGRRGIYENVLVTAYVTYRELEHLEIRGNQELTCLSPIRAETFTLKAYGENDITLASLKTRYLRTSLYGQNSLRIRDGRANLQKYRLFGENKIDTQGLVSKATIANTYGESKLKLTTEDELKVNAFGESRVMYNGNAQVNKRIIIGETKISRLD